MSSFTAALDHRMPLPRGSALGRDPRLEPLVAYRPVVEPRVPLVAPLVVPLVVPLVDPREEAGILGVGLEEIMLGGFSTNEVSVVLRSKNVFSMIAKRRRKEAETPGDLHESHFCVIGRLRCLRFSCY